MLRTTITIYPPSMNDRAQVSHLLIDVKQGSFFTVLPSWQSNPTERRSAVPKWYASNIYSLSAAPSQVVPLPVAPSMQQPTTYDLFVSGDYEVRLVSSYLLVERYRAGAHRSGSSEIRNIEIQRFPSCSSTSQWAFNMRGARGWASTNPMMLSLTSSTAGPSASTLV